MRKRPLLWFACVFLSGLAYERYGWLILLVVPMCFIGIEVYYGVKSKTICKIAGRSMILLSAFLLGMMHMQKEENFRDTYMSQLETDSDVVCWGEIKKIEHTDYGVRMILTDCYIHLNEENVPCNDILVYASSAHFQVGEIHKIKGKLNLFETARNQGNFDSKVFYQSQRIDVSVWLESNELLGVKENALRDFLLFFKSRISQVFTECMDKSASGFFIGMLLGDRSALDEEIKDLFTLGGISHILAISGLHVSMIGRNFYTLLRKCGIGFISAGIMAGALLLGYGFLVGNGMSAVRAIGMMLIFFLGQIIGRSYDMLNALGAMVIFLLWENPFLLEYSGFWFSIMALIGVGFVGNAFSKEVKSFGMSLGITLTTLPVVAYCYYEIPLYSPFVNCIVLPMLTPIFMLALGGGIIGLCFPVFAKILLLPCSWGLGFYIWLCEFIEKLPFSSIICGMPKAWVIVVYYMLLALSVTLLQWLESKKRKIKTQNGKLKNARKSKWLIVITSLVCLSFITYPKSKPFEITFLDVGQGDGIYISTGDDTTYFIDGGSTSVDGVGEYRILPFLKSKGIASIDYWFVSHADSDHISGILEVMESGYKVGYLVVSKYAPKDENLEQLLSVADRCGIDVLYMEAGDVILSDKSSFTCLYPWSISIQDKNDTSLVFKFQVDLKRYSADGVIFVADEKVNVDKSVLKAFFAGDISSEVEELLLERRLIDDIWLYKVSHHGSRYSNSLELLEILQPEIAVISCGENNLYGHPHEETLTRLESIGSNVLQTSQSGQVTFLLLQ